MEYNKSGVTSQVFYRKWRPQSLSEVVGQEHVTQTLRNAVESGRLAHAYLFCGPRGTGKTSTGRILAKAANCLKPHHGEPCNNCDLCRAVNEGSALDVIEIDAASNRGIDEIRELREKVNYAPNIARYKVYIIDEVHMITRDASNAFLKTLEEPPPHAIFILATTEPHKVIATILSRCQRFDFHRLSQSAVIAKLNLVCEKESISIEPESLTLIAKATTGSLRDAENLLEQLVAHFGREIELHQVREMLGISGDLRIRKLAEHIIGRDIPAGLRAINSINNDALDLRQFNRELVGYLRELLLVKSGTEEVVDVTSEDLAEMKKLVAGTNLEYLMTAVKLFGDIDLRMDNYSPLPLELALVECILSTVEEQRSQFERKGVVKPAADARQPLQKVKVEEATAAYVPTTEKIVFEKPAQETKKTAMVASPEAEGAAVLEELTVAASLIPGKVALPPAASEPGTTTKAAEAPDGGFPHDIEYIRSHWKEFIHAMRGEGSTGNLDAFLRSACEPVGIEDGAVILGFFFDFHKDKIEDPKYKHLVEKKLREVFGHPYKLRCILTPREKKAPLSPQLENPMVDAARKRGARVIGVKPKTEE